MQLERRALRSIQPNQVDGEAPKFAIGFDIETYAIAGREPRKPGALNFGHVYQDHVLAELDRHFAQTATAVVRFDDANHAEQSLVMCRQRP